ncbi:MAG: SVM family protein [Candidatus Phytoplasma pruni]|nr:SVM family protein [Candidatus Phytoplasma pruni]
MIKLKKQFKIIYLCLITFIGLLFINNNKVIAMNNLNDENSINNEINKIYLERKKIATQISYFHIYHLEDDVELQKKLNNLDQTIKNLYQRRSDVNILKYINEQIWHYSYERNQIVNKIFSYSYQDPTIQELNLSYQELIQKIQNLQQKYINLQYKLNKFD